ncbi:hypothetical protein [Vibrio sp. SCSIO 43136]|uniref:hypothetical protein n=1 Tax=Vibrio sp. SCSIO 43136 TaxID=2819101 RepID=UPI002074F2E9|nr:hypothetical protein [Vibrio sp. SCSIO 43136]USD64221.1 hypothetical protein J4N39_08865 [Vibrio sp. SCSIO 43136]
MDFALRFTLLQLLNNDIEAYRIAHAFVADTQNKYDVFKLAYEEALPEVNHDISSAASVAADKALVRWNLLNEGAA